MIDIAEEDESELDNIEGLDINNEVVLNNSEHESKMNEKDQGKSSLKDIEKVKVQTDLPYPIWINVDSRNQIVPKLKKEKYKNKMPFERKSFYYSLQHKQPPPSKLPHISFRYQSQGFLDKVRRNTGSMIKFYKKKFINVKRNLKISPKLFIEITGFLATILLMSLLQPNIA